jgi:hypothetical protein
MHKGKWLEQTGTLQACEHTYKYFVCSISLGEDIYYRNFSDMLNY